MESIGHTYMYNAMTFLFDRSKPIKFIEKSRAGAQMLCSSFSPGGIFLTTGNSDSVVRIYSYNFGRFEKIAELDAHKVSVFDDKDRRTLNNHVLPSTTYGE